MGGWKPLHKYVLSHLNLEIMEEIPVGSRLTLEVVETTNYSCDGCFFDEIAKSLYDDFCKQLKCSRAERKDNKSIIYKVVEE